MSLESEKQRDSCSESVLLLERLQHQDPVAWDDFYRQYAPFIVALGTARGLNAADCDDLVQEVMRGFFDTSKRFIFDPARAKFSTYFRKIVISAIADFYQRNRREANWIVHADANEKTPSAVADCAQEPFAELFESQWLEFLQRIALAELARRRDPRTVSAFEMYALKKISAPQVAELLRMSVANVYQAKKRCSSDLRAFVKRYWEA